MGPETNNKTINIKKFEVISENTISMNDENYVISEICRHRSAQGAIKFKLLVACKMDLQEYKKKLQECLDSKHHIASLLWLITVSNDGTPVPWDVLTGNYISGKLVPGWITETCACCKGRFRFNASCCLDLKTQLTRRRLLDLRSPLLKRFSMATKRRAGAI